MQGSDCWQPQDSTPVLTAMFCPDLLGQLVGLSLVVQVDNGDLHFWSMLQCLSGPHTLAHAGQLWAGWVGHCVRSMHTNLKLCTVAVPCSVSDADQAATGLLTPSRAALHT